MPREDRLPAKPVKPIPAPVKKVIPLKPAVKKPAAPAPGKRPVASASTKINSYRQIRDLLKGQGLPAPVAGWAAAAVFHETGDLTSRVSKQDHNYSGIKFINKPYQDATKGTPAPKNEGGGNYARFSSTAKWAKDYARILKLKPAEPAKATSLKDFVSRLHNNKYFTDNPANYEKGVQFFYNKYAGNAVAADNELNKARADQYAKDAGSYKQQAQDAIDANRWNFFNGKMSLKDLFTPKNIAIGFGVWIAVKVLNRR